MRADISYLDLPSCLRIHGNAAYSRASCTNARASERARAGPQDVYRGPRTVEWAQERGEGGTISRYA